MPLHFFLHYYYSRKKKLSLHWRDLFVFVFIVITSSLPSVQVEWVAVMSVKMSNLSIYQRIFKIKNNEIIILFAHFYVCTIYGKQTQGNSVLSATTIPSSGWWFISRNTQSISHIYKCNSGNRPCVAYMCTSNQP